MAGIINELWRFPVKSMKGESLAQAELRAGGILGDRAYALIENETGKVVSAKSVKLYPNLLRCSAAYTAPPRSDTELPPVKINLFDGPTVLSNSSDANQVLSEYFGRELTLAPSAPDNYTIDQFHPDLENMDPQGHRNISVEQKLGSALFAEMGVDSPIPAGSFMDVFPITIMTSATLEHLNELSPETNFDHRRFRMNLIVGTEGNGFLENSWIGKTMTVGSNINLVGAMPDPRCVMTTLAQDDIPADSNVLRTLAKHNRLDIMGAGEYPCAGIYAIVGSTGEIKVGDMLTVHD